MVRPPHVSLLIKLELRDKSERVGHEERKPMITNSSATAQSTRNAAEPACWAGRVCCYFPAPPAAERPSVRPAVAADARRWAEAINRV